MTQLTALEIEQLHVDVVKVDQSFVRGLGNSAEDTAIVVGVVRLAQALGLSAVAEGVETVEQAAQLVFLGCGLAQGFHWTEPLAADALLAWLDEFGAASADLPERGVANRALRVLLVDDQPAIRDLIRVTMLLEGGFDIVAEASNGLEAIAHAAALQPDLVVLDLMMPVLDGAQALPRILAVAPDSKVVVLSSVDADAVSPDALTGAAGYFDKTADLSAVIARLTTLAAGAIA